MGLSTASVTYCDHSEVTPKLCLPFEILCFSPSDYKTFCCEFNSSPTQLELTSLFYPIIPAAQERTDSNFRNILLFRPQLFQNLNRTSDSSPIRQLKRRKSFSLLPCFPVGKQLWIDKMMPLARLFVA